MIWYIFPIKESISWEGHLSGFLVGLLFAYIFRKTGPQKQQYEFRETEFDNYFDKDGNFVPPKPENTEQEENTATATYRKIDFTSDRDKEL